MRLQRRLLVPRCTLAIAILGLLAMAPLAFADQAFTVMSSLNSTTPFNVTLPSTLSNGHPVKTVVIQFVTADCDATAGTTYIGSAFIRIVFEGSFFYYTLPFPAGMSFPTGVEFSSAQQTEMFADPGSTLNYGLSADMPTCTVVFSGHLIPQ
jgi:hypothetical protein